MKNVLKKNIKVVISLVVGIAIGAGVMGCLWPERVPKLKDGSEVVIEIKGKKFTAEDFYQKMKDAYSVDTAIELIDNYILLDKYKGSEEDALKFAKEKSVEVYSSYEQYYGYTKEQFLNENGFENEDAFIERLKKEYYYQKYFDEYTRGTIKDSEIEKYYNNSVFGPKKIWLFTSDSTKDLENVIKDLKKSPKFENLQSKYSNVNAIEYENVTYKDANTYSTDLIKTIANLGKGKNSKVIQDSKYGNFVVYVEKEEKKEAFKVIKEEIIETMVAEKEQNNEKLYYQAFMALRDDYGMKIYDTSILDKYNETHKQYKKE